MGKVMFKRTFALNDAEKRKVSDMSGKIMLWMLEGRGCYYMAEKLDMHPQQVNCNIDEMLYVLRKNVGVWRFIKTLFRK